MTREAAIKWKKEIVAFQNGKTIEVKRKNKTVWEEAIEPEFHIFNEYRIKPEEKPEQKRIIELSDDGETWFEATRFIPKCEKLYARVRVEKQPTKRLPTIEEVEKWFFENKVFKSNCGRYLQKISSLHRAPINTLYINIGCGSLTIKDFVSHYKHYNGTELYITEN